MKVKRHFIFFILSCCVFQSNAQNFAHDSIAKMLKSNIHDTIKFSSLSNYIESGLEETVWPVYNDKLLILSKQAAQKTTGPLKIVYLSYYAYALSNKGFEYINVGNFYNAKKQYTLALEIQKKNNLISAMGSTYINLGFIANKEGNTPMALEYYHSALKIFLKIKDINQAADVYNNIAFIFGKEAEDLQALKYYQQSLAMYSQKKNLSGVALVINNISYLYAFKGDPFCKDSKEECILTGRKKAVLLLERAIKIEDSLNTKIELAGSLNMLAGFYDEFGNPNCIGQENCIQTTKNRTLELYKHALELRIETNHTTGLVLSYQSLAKHMLLINDLDKAEMYGKKCFQLSKTIGTPEYIKDAAEILSKIYKNQKKYKESLNMYELFINKRDSIGNNVSKKATIQKGFQIEYEKKAAADSVRVAEEKKLTTVKLKQEQTQRYFLYGGLGLTALFGIFMFNRFRITQKQKNVIEEQKLIVEKQKHIVDEKQKEILDSIHYAKRIQQSLLPTEKFIDRVLKNKN